MAPHVSEAYGWGHDKETLRSCRDVSHSWGEHYTDVRKTLNSPQEYSRLTLRVLSLVSKDRPIVRRDDCEEDWGDPSLDQ